MELQNSVFGALLARKVICYGQVAVLDSDITSVTLYYLIFCSRRFLMIGIWYVVCFARPCQSTSVMSFNWLLSGGQTSPWWPWKRTPWCCRHIYEYVVSILFHPVQLAKYSADEDLRGRKHPVFYLPVAYFARIIDFRSYVDATMSLYSMKWNTSTVSMLSPSKGFSHYGMSLMSTLVAWRAYKGPPFSSSPLYLAAMLTMMMHWLYFSKIQTVFWK